MWKDLNSSLLSKLTEYHIFDSFLQETGSHNSKVSVSDSTSVFRSRNLCLSVCK